ncbi:MAG: hypothetical protein OEL84_03680 [Nitrosopumilus sp.]|nr:hypothetical protein [Nitrosopumilus sp.]
MSSHPGTTINNVKRKLGHGSSLPVEERIQYLQKIKFLFLKGKSLYVALAGDLFLELCRVMKNDTATIKNHRKPWDLAKITFNQNQENMIKDLEQNNIGFLKNEEEAFELAKKAVGVLNSSLCKDVLIIIYEKRNLTTDKDLSELCNNPGTDNTKRKLIRKKLIDVLETKNPKTYRLTEYGIKLIEILTLSSIKKRYNKLQDDAKKRSLNRGL